MRKIDDYTVVFEFPEPYCLLRLPARGKHGDRRRAGHARSLPELRRRLCAGPLPEAVPAQVLVRGGGEQEGQGRRLRQLGVATQEPLQLGAQHRAADAGPWKTVSPINTPTWSMERNPYYWAVDTAGNQLPYIDRITMTLAENLEVVNLRAIAGEYDLQERHMHLSKLPVFLENAEEGQLHRPPRPALNGSDAALLVNTAYEADPEIAKWLKNRDFRRALSLGIDRDQLNEAFWLGIGTPGSWRPRRRRRQQPGQGVPQEVGRPRSEAGQRAARQGRADQEGRRGLPPAHRRQGTRCASK